MKSTSPKRKSFKRLAVASAAVLSSGTVAALALGVTPASAATIAQNPDTQIAVFLIPLTLLMAAVLFEVSRVALRGALPADTPMRRITRRRWSPGHGEG